MVLSTIPLPYGLRDVKIYPITAGVPATTGVDLPNAQTFSFSEAEDTTELRGDDGLVAIHGHGPQVAFSLQGGGISLEAVKALYGGTITSSGTTPSQVKSFKKLVTDARPYFQVIGKAISDSGGDFHVTLYKAKCTGELSGEMSDGNFWLTGASGSALGDGTGQLYLFEQNESEVALA